MRLIVFILVLVAFTASANSEEYCNDAGVCRKTRHSVNDRLKFNSQAEAEADLKAVAEADKQTQAEFDESWFAERLQQCRDICEEMILSKACADWRAAAFNAFNKTHFIHPPRGAVVQELFNHDPWRVRPQFTANNYEDLVNRAAATKSSVDQFIHEEFVGCLKHLGVAYPKTTGRN